METTTAHLSPASTTLDIDTMDQHFLKLEDVHAAASPSSSTFDDDDEVSPLSTTLTHDTPAPVLVQSKPAKKRKSWGQLLPEPKTALPPRKRAKTDDEKEQRRIERIKRNRAAAHNSRERKRQETETLAVALARANAELEAYRSLHGPLPANIVLPEVTLVHDLDDTPPPSLSGSHGTADGAPSPKSPGDITFHYGTAHIKQETLDNPFPVSTTTTTTTTNFDYLTPKSSPLSPLDPTQHSAAMLCDLQCRSRKAANTRGTTPSSLTPSLRSTLPASWLVTTVILSLLHLHLQSTYKTVLMAIWSLSPSRMALLIRASQLRSTSPLTTSSTTPRRPLLWRRSTALAQRNAATGRAARAQGAFVALQRAVGGSDGVPRVEVGAAAGGLRRQPRLVRGHQQGALEDERLRQDCDTGIGDDENGGR